MRTDKATYVSFMRKDNESKKKFNMKILNQCTYAGGLMAVCWRSVTEKIETAKLAKLVKINYRLFNYRSTACIMLK